MEQKDKKKYDAPRLTTVRLDTKTAVLATNCKTSGIFGPSIFGCDVPAGCETEGS